MHNFEYVSETLETRKGSSFHSVSNIVVYRVYVQDLCKF